MIYIFGGGVPCPYVCKREGFAKGNRMFVNGNVIQNVLVLLGREVGRGME